MYTVCVVWKTALMPKERLVLPCSVLMRHWPEEGVMLICRDRHRRHSHSPLLPEPIRSGNPHTEPFWFWCFCMVWCQLKSWHSKASHTPTTLNTSINITKKKPGYTLFQVWWRLFQKVTSVCIYITWGAVVAASPTWICIVNVWCSSTLLVDEQQRERAQIWSSLLLP